MRIDLTANLKKLYQLDLFRVFSLTAISTLVKIFTGFITIKIVASQLGPAGIALIGQLNNFVAIFIVIASAGINQGVTKYISENKDSIENVKLFIGTAFKLTLISSLICSLALIVFFKFLSIEILESPDYWYVFLIFGLVIIFYALNNLLLSILNGFQLYRKFVVINIVTSFVGLLFTVLLVYFWQIKGALISVISYQSVMFIISYRMMRKEYWFEFLSFKEKIDTIIARHYLKYTLMALTTAATVPVSQLLIRTYVISNLSIVEAGYWEGMNKLSSVYLLLITTSLSVYFLPKLSELKTDHELRNEIFRAYKIIMPALFVGIIIIYFLRFNLIEMLFSKSFYPMAKLFLFQLMGDFFKIGSWLLAFNMIAKSMTTTFIISEILYSLLFVVLSIYFVNISGVQGITFAYSISYIIYSILMILLFRKLLFIKSN
jgi:O-antigen/teichoic acid export membrane protein